MICFNVLVYNIRIANTEKKKAKSVRFSPVITALLSAPRPAKAQGEIVRGAGHNFHFAGLRTLLFHSITAVGHCCRYVRCLTSSLLLVAFPYFYFLLCIQLNVILG